MLCTSAHFWKNCHHGRNLRKLLNFVWHNMASSHYICFLCLRGINKVDVYPFWITWNKSLFLLSQVGYVNFSPFYHNPELPVKRVINSSLQVVTILTSNDTLAEASDEYPVCLPELHITSPAWCDLWTFSDDTMVTTCSSSSSDLWTFSYASMVTTCSIVVYLGDLTVLALWQAWLVKTVPTWTLFILRI